eukprot:scaffold145578_cov13-Tisochrysis_lutea.AAC.1
MLWQAAWMAWAGWEAGSATVPISSHEMSRLNHEKGVVTECCSLTSRPVSFHSASLSARFGAQAYELMLKV